VLEGVLEMLGWMRSVFITFLRASQFEEGRGVIGIGGKAEQVTRTITWGRNHFKTFIFMQLARALPFVYICSRLKLWEGFLE